MVYINATLFNGLNEINDKTIQKAYTDAINKINLNRLRCCLKSNGSFKIHAYYKRTFRLKENIVTISILRIRCEHCGKTHAVFFNDFIPYSSFSSVEGQMALSNFIDDTFSYELLEKIKKIKSKIMIRLTFLRKRIIDNMEDLIDASIKSFQLHFLQIHRGHVVSYLLDFT